ncbi:hypothetical protein PUN28_008093 [Cardiocondyla obscurior]|uniref:Uncharacterized protein n=1 Tax=Cardiocondyla obscurior TaxID=286306 RepID=A0AAW2FY94_9HYME
MYKRELFLLSHLAKKSLSTGHDHSDSIQVLNADVRDGCVFDGYSRGSHNEYVRRDTCRQNLIRSSKIAFAPYPRAFTFPRSFFTNNYYRGMSSCHDSFRGKQRRFSFNNRTRWWFSNCASFVLNYTRVKKKKKKKFYVGYFTTTKSFVENTRLTESDPFFILENHDDDDDDGGVYLLESAVNETDVPPRISRTSVADARVPKKNNNNNNNHSKKSNKYYRLCRHGSPKKFSPKTAPTTTKHNHRQDTGLYVNETATRDCEATKSVCQKRIVNDHYIRHTLASQSYGILLCTVRTPPKLNGDKFRTEKSCVILRALF